MTKTIFCKCRITKKQYVAVKKIAKARKMIVSDFLRSLLTKAGV